jgi:hypothetical protein
VTLKPREVVQAAIDAYHDHLMLSSTLWGQLCSGI